MGFSFSGYRHREPRNRRIGRAFAQPVGSSP
jgi:hypothetical protein